MLQLFRNIIEVFIILILEVISDTNKESSHTWLCLNVHIKNRDPILYQKLRRFSISILGIYLAISLSCCFCQLKGRGRWSRICSSAIRGDTVRLYVWVCFVGFNIRLRFIEWWLYPRFGVLASRLPVEWNSMHDLTVTSLIGRCRRYLFAEESHELVWNDKSSEGGKCFRIFTQNKTHATMVNSKKSEIEEDGIWTKHGMRKYFFVNALTS